MDRSSKTFSRATAGAGGNAHGEDRQWVVSGYLGRALESIHPVEWTSFCFSVQTAPAGQSVQLEGRGHLDNRWKGFWCICWSFALPLWIVRREWNLCLEISNWHWPCLGQVFPHSSKAAGSLSQLKNSIIILFCCTFPLIQTWKILKRPTWSLTEPISTSNIGQAWDSSFKSQQRERERDVVKHKKQQKWGQSWDNL